MPLDAGIIERSIGELNPVNQLQKMQALKTMQLQQQDIGSQTQERNAIAAQRQAEVQQGTAAAQVMQDHFASQVAAGKPIDFDDPELLKKLYAASPKFADTYSTTRAKLNADKATAAVQAATVAKTQQEIANPKVDEYSPTGVAAKIAIAQGTPRNIDPNSPAGIAAAMQKTQGESQIPERPQGIQQPQRATPPMSPGLFDQQKQLRQIASDAAAARQQPTTATIDDPDNPGHQMLVTIDRSGGTALPVTIAGQTATKTPSAQLNKTTAQSKSYDDAQQSLTALEKLAKQNTYIADQAMADQYFNIVKPGSGARMNQQNINRLITPGPLKDRLIAWAQKLDQGQPLDAPARQAMIEAARVVAESKKPPETAGAGQVAPEGTVITLANGQRQVKRGGKWVNQ